MQCASYKGLGIFAKKLLYNYFLQLGSNCKQHCIANIPIRFSAGGVTIEYYVVAPSLLHNVSQYILHCVVL